jgi:hypothetical protein
MVDLPVPNLLMSGCLPFPSPRFGKKLPMKILVILPLVALLAACGGGGGSANNGNANQVKQLNPLHVAHNAIAGHSLQINMGAQSNSGQAGNASVTDVKDGVNVTIHIKSEPKGATEPAHIHPGTCTKLNPAPWKPLNPVVNGNSMTHVAGISVAQIKKGKYAVNVHKSATDLKTYVSCGDLTL